MIDGGGFFANPATGMTTKTRNRLIVLFIFGFPFMVLLGFLVSQLVGPLPPIQPLPNPNGYDALVKAGEMVSTNSWNYDSTNLDQLHETVATNAGALALARAGMSNECRVPLQFTLRDSENIEQLISFRSLAYAFAGEGKLAESENRPDNAAKSYLDTIHLGNEVGRGGRLVEGMIGTAIESLGTTGLQKVIDQLDVKTCRETAAALEVLDAHRQTWEDVLQQEKNWSRRVFGLRGQLIELFFGRQLGMMRNEERAEQAFKEHQKQTRQLTVDLAARAYELDKGQKPASLADLAPDYLKAVPQDPFTGTNMNYSPR
jgi:hypothetical protein